MRREDLPGLPDFYTHRAAPDAAPGCPAELKPPTRDEILGARSGGDRDEIEGAIVLLVRALGRGKLTRTEIMDRLDIDQRIVDAVLLNALRTGQIVRYRIDLPTDARVRYRYALPIVVRLPSPADPDESASESASA